MERRCTIRVAVGLAVMVALAAPAVPAIAARATSKRTATGLAAKDDSVFPMTIVEGGRELGRTRVVWSSSKVSGRKASYAVMYSFGSQVQGVKAPPAIRALYYDRATQTNVLAVLSFIRQTDTPSSPTSQTERFYHASTNATFYPLFAGARLPFSAPVPVTTGEGVSDALLASMYYDPSVYSIVGSAWDGREVDKDGLYGRWANYTLRRIGTAYSAIYGGDVSLPDVRVYDGVAYYSADATIVAAAHEATTASDASSTTSVPGALHGHNQGPRSIWPYVAGAVAATSALGSVVFWYKRRKKRAADEEDEEEGSAGDEDHDPDAQDEASTKGDQA